MTDVAAVTALVEHVAATVVRPRFRALAEGDVGEKGPGDLVTVVDREAEVALTRGLREIEDVPVVGEEATADDPRLLRALVGAPRAWVVDPIDGTRAFVEGEPDYAVMVGLVSGGEAVAGWICLPEDGATYVAERGAGAFRDGERLARPPAGPEPRAELATRYLPPGVRAALLARLDGRPGSGRVVPVDSPYSGRQYSRLATGDLDAMLFWRTWPWDHAPGAVLLREVGGVARRADGTEYRPAVVADGLLDAADDAAWSVLRDALDLASL